MPITSRIIKDEQERLEFLPKFLKSRFMDGETLTYILADEHIEGYTGGMWDFAELSNGGFIMLPPFDKDDDKFHVTNNMNYADVNISREAAGLFVTTMSISSLMHGTSGTLQTHFVKLFEKNMDYIRKHKEASALYQLLD